MKRWRLGAAVGAAALAGAAGLYLLNAASPQDAVADVRVPWQWHLTADETPVRVELHDYAGPRAAEGVVEGEPLVFEFPRSAFVYRENQRGGPQQSIMLAVDRETGQLLAPLIFRETGARSHDVPIHYQRFEDRDLLISVASDKLLVDDYDPFTVFRNFVDMGQVELQGEACGLRLGFADNANVAAPDAPELIVGGVDLYGGDVRGIALDPAGPTAELQCARNADICRVSLVFEGREASYTLPKSRLCEHRQYSAQVADFLRRHRVRSN